MKPLPKLVVIAFLMTLVVWIGRHDFHVMGMEASDSECIEPADAGHLEGSRFQDIRWDEIEDPVSALSPANRFKRANTRRPLRPGDQVLRRSLEEALSQFHARFVNAFIPYNRRFEDCRSDGIGGLLRTPMTRWFQIEWSRGVFFEGRRAGVGDDFLLPFTRFVSYRNQFFDASEFMSNSGDSAQFDPSEVPSDDLVRLIESSNEPVSKTEWKLERVELVKFPRRSDGAPPSPHAPIGTFYSVAPAGRLNSFETRAIKRLQLSVEKQVVIDENPDEIQIVGALRNSRSCAKCHEGGGLLGVFTYQLTRANVATTDTATTRGDE